MHLEIDRQPAGGDAEDRAGAAKRCWPTCAPRARLAADAAKMLDVAEDLASRKLPVSDAGKREAQEFLRWAADNHFTFLGYREYEVVEKGGEEVLARGQGQRPGPAARQGRRQAAPAEVAGGALHAAVGLGRCADPDQDQRARHRAPPGLHGLHRRAQLRRQGQAGRARSASSACTPPAPTTAARGTSRWCASATTT